MKGETARRRLVNLHHLREGKVDLSGYKVDHQILILSREETNHTRASFPVNPFVPQI